MELFKLDGALGKHGGEPALKVSAPNIGWYVGKLVNRLCLSYGLYVSMYFKLGLEIVVVHGSSKSILQEKRVRFNDRSSQRRNQSVFLILLIKQLARLC